MIYTAILLLCSVLFPVQATIETTLPEISKDSLTIRVVDYDELKPLLEMDSDTTYVVNFWATWCLPCVKELPYFIQLDSIYNDKAFKLLLVSLDFKRDYLRKLQPFARERSIEEHILILEDNRSNYWIEDIDKSWGGSIPATLVYKGQKREFYERTFHDVNELSDIVEQFLNQ